MKDIIKFVKNKKLMLMFATIGIILLVLWILFLIFYISHLNTNPPNQPQEQADATDQGRSDRYFSESERKFFEEHPWYDKLPRSTDNYFLFFNPQANRFVADIYRSPSASSDEINGVKKEVFDYLSSIGVSVSGARFSWSFISKPTPEP